jgi:hypothetical protein
MMPEDAGHTSPQIERLKELAALVIAQRDTTHVLWEVLGGVCEGVGLLVVPPGATALEPGGGILACEMKPGQCFPRHMQPYCTEILIVINGELDVAVWADGAGPEDLPMRTPRIAPGLHLSLAPGVEHQATAVSRIVDGVETAPACLVVGVTVPKDGGYPEAAHGPDGFSARPAA